VEQSAALLPAYGADLHLSDQWDHYIITATLNPDLRRVEGEMWVSVRNHADMPLKTVAFHLYPNHPDFGGSLWVADQIRVGGRPVTVTTEQDGVLLWAPLPEPLPPGERTSVALRFAARSPAGRSDQSYGAFNQEAGVWSLAEFYPVLAWLSADGWDRRVVDSTGDFAVTTTALYDVTLTMPDAWKPVTTGVSVGAAGPPPSPGYRRERFVSGPQREFFVAAVSGLEQTTATVEGTRIVSYYQQDNAVAGRQSLHVAVRAVQVFNEAYGRYPLTELEVVQAALTRFYGVEYPGVVLIEQQLYHQNERLLETIIAHEVSHQWWYNLVGTDAQGEPWLDEGLASFSQMFYHEAVGNPSQAAAELDQFRAQYRSLRNAGRDGIVNRPATALSTSYYTLAYAKPALFFQALRRSLGDDMFFRSLHHFFQTYRYEEATGEDLLASVEATCGCNVRSLYEDWITMSRAVEVP